MSRIKGHFQDILSIETDINRSIFAPSFERVTMLTIVIVRR